MFYRPNRPCFYWEPKNSIEYFQTSIPGIPLNISFSLQNVSVMRLNSPRRIRMYFWSSIIHVNFSVKIKLWNSWIESETEKISCNRDSCLAKTKEYKIQLDSNIWKIVGKSKGILKKLPTLKSGIIFFFACRTNKV